MFVYCVVNKESMRFFIDVLYYMIIKFIKLIIKFEIKIFIIEMNFEKKLLKLFFYSMLKFSFFFFCNEYSFFKLFFSFLFKSCSCWIFCIGDRDVDNVKFLFFDVGLFFLSFLK